ncbi:ArnT family glycosyltransferase [Dichotomicrobium thermohalophilum]|uniref:ArnT family glycosyltransferase n=1 Tax=Dichotomicrobium thermohalophilum TaxID=933063 RepID=UPI001474015F|nr:glycosyltransferase family 39 protein [Dichotomicrobium thermohalophilum]
MSAHPRAGGNAPPGASEPRPIFPVDMLPQGFVWRLVVFLGALTAVRLATVYFAGTDFFFDEAQYWAWSRDLDWGYYSKPPVIAWLIRAASEICGNGEACIRAISPVMHTATSVIVFLLTRKLFDARFGFWAAVVFATLPGISLSSTLISTDVPLLFFWALALLCLVKLLETRAWRWSVALGLTVGVGLLAKYAMVYFFLGLAVYMLLSPRARWLLTDLRGAMVLLLAGALLAPNVIWNLQHGFATFSHTADNANWSGSLGNPIEALEFFGAQFGVFGPLLFGILIWATWRAVREGWSDPYRLLLCFAVPVILLITVQAFLSRAHANWAAVAYVSASVLVAALMVERSARGWYAASFLIHLLALATISFGTVFAGQISLPGGKDPFARVLGWQAIAKGTEARFADGDFASVMTDRRSLAAELIYYLRDTDIPIARWRNEGPPSDHFEMTRPITAQTPEPVLLVTRRERIGSIGERFDSVTKLGQERFSAGPTDSRELHFYRLEGFRPAD